MKLNLQTFFLVFFTIINLSNAQTHLSYKLKVGDEFKINQVATQDIVQDMNNVKHEMKNEIEADYLFVIQDASDSLYHIKFKFNRFKMETTSNQYGKMMDIDTDKPVSDDDLEGKIFSQLLVTELHMKMYKNGKIKSIEGSKTLIDKMIDAAGDFDEFTKELVREAMKKEFSNETLAKSFEQMTYIYPSKKVKISDSWTNKFEGELTADNVWTLNDIKNDDVMISGISTILFNSDDDEINMSLTGKMTSDITASLDSGFLKSMSSKTVASGDSIMKGMNGIKVPTSITTNTTYKIEKNVQ